MKYSIIIPCYNEADNIDDVLRRILPLTEGRELEFLLVENGSKDGSRDVFRERVEGKYPGVRTVYVEENQGYGYGLQQGIKAAQGDYIGWIHADMQMPPEELIRFFEEVERHSPDERLFLKGRRTNRSAFDRFFTAGQSVYNTLLFGRRLYDVGAIPVLFSRELLDGESVDAMPNDFSIEIYVYNKAAEKGFTQKRLRVKLMTREKGSSSWNHGLSSKIRQSKRIFRDSLKIKKGEKVL